MSLCQSRFPQKLCFKGLFQFLSHLCDALQAVTLQLHVCSCLAKHVGQCCAGGRSMILSGSRAGLRHLTCGHACRDHALLDWAHASR